MKFAPMGAGVGEPGGGSSGGNWVDTTPGYTGGPVDTGQGTGPGPLPGWGPGGMWRPGGWQTPDYSSLIAGDYEVQFAETEMASRMARARAGYRKNLNQALIDLGVVDQGKLGGLGQYVDKDTIQKAAENKYSTMAQIAQKEAVANATTGSRLAARGIESSGQATKSARDIIAGAEQSRYSSLRDFLRSGEEGLMGLSDLESELGYRLASARSAAAQRAASMYQPTYLDPWNPIPGYGGEPIDLSGIDWMPSAGQLQAGVDKIYGPARPRAPRTGGAYATWAQEHGYTG
jgi:hypothetical protein